MSKGVRADRISTEMRVTAFWMQVEHGRPDECWPWIGYTEKGYGRFYDGTRMRQAHELALTYTTGEVRSRNLDTCHSCHNLLCCNPTHLRFDTRASNVSDAVRAGRHAVGERNGHASLTNQQVRQIREQHAAGASARVLAERWGVSAAAISYIVTGRRWKEAGGPIRTHHGNTKHGRYSK